ncbi:hypothetical protein D0T12_24660 [Actinomadura spongiicola]|uniref:Uncharacterized protein n=1 Tax=Actinomadura spongiicola TaxID=2303421 RepID=A0A372GC06_9ACTN|nr:hypothetical protein D0T12_24660 [Actinomadura spongiicola]
MFSLLDRRLGVVVFGFLTTVVVLGVVFGAGFLRSGGLVGGLALGSGCLFAGPVVGWGRCVVGVPVRGLRGVFGVACRLCGVVTRPGVAWCGVRAGLRLPWGCLIGGLSGLFGRGFAAVAQGGACVPGVLLGGGGFGGVLPGEGLVFPVLGAVGLGGPGGWSLLIAFAGGGAAVVGGAVVLLRFALVVVLAEGLGFTGRFAVPGCGGPVLTVGGGFGAVGLAVLCRVLLGFAGTGEALQAGRLLG